MCGVEIDYWGYQDPMAERYGFLEIATLATFGPDPTRPAGRPDPWTTLLQSSLTEQQPYIGHRSTDKRQL